MSTPTATHMQPAGADHLDPRNKLHCSCGLERVVRALQLATPMLLCLTYTPPQDFSTIEASLLGKKQRNSTYHTTHPSQEWLSKKHVGAAVFYHHSRHRVTMLQAASLHREHDPALQGPESVSATPL